MQDTKQMILREALRLFALNGYEGVSVRDIAGRLGISQSALYKHYSCKRDIFDSIVARMREEDRLRAADFDVPEDVLGEMAEEYRITALSALEGYALSQFLYWANDDFAADFRRLLTLEQYRSPDMTALYQQYLSGGVISYLADLFGAMEELSPRPEQPQLLALEFYAPVYMLLNLYDAATDKQAIEGLARRHITGFFERLKEKK